jgi:hypothetical protein
VQRWARGTVIETYTDGMSLSNSSNLTIWPVYLVTVVSFLKFSCETIFSLDRLTMEPCSSTNIKD